MEDAYLDSRFKREPPRNIPQATLFPPFSMPYKPSNSPQFFNTHIYVKRQPVRARMRESSPGP